MSTERFDAASRSVMQIPSTSIVGSLDGATHRRCRQAARASASGRTLSAGFPATKDIGVADRVDHTLSGADVAEGRKGRFIIKSVDRVFPSHDRILVTSCPSLLRRLQFIPRASQ
jgi:hypothetical protein